MPTLIPENARKTASPVPVVVHIVTAIPYLALGALQFSRRFLRRWPAWHREFIIRNGGNRTARARGEGLLS